MLNMADVAAMELELSELRTLKLKLIRSGGVEEYSSGGKRIRRFSLKQINDAINELERQLAAYSGSNFHLACPLE